MRRWGPYLVWMVVTLLLAGATAMWVSNLERNRSSEPRRSVPGSEGDFHKWMHDNLDLNPAQHEALEPFERDYETRRRVLRDEIATAGRDLATAVRGGDPESSGIEESLGRLNAAQADLQRATLDHFFAMKEHLDPGQAEKLLTWIHDSIVPE